MANSFRIAGIACIALAVAGFIWFVLESAPPRLGFEDTDDPALMVRFIRAHPQVFPQAGVALIVMAISLVTAVAASARVIARGENRLDLQIASIFGFIAAALFLFGGGIRIGSSGRCSTWRICARSGETERTSPRRSPRRPS